MIYVLYALLALLVCSLYWNFVLYRKAKALPPQTIESVTRTQDAEALLAEMLHNGAAQIQVFPGSDFLLRSPRG
jgi:hypothetical protein